MELDGTTARNLELSFVVSSILQVSGMSTEKVLRRRFIHLYRSWLFTDFFYFNDRAQMDNLGVKPYTSTLKKMRGRKLALAFPKYDSRVIMDFSETDPLMKIG